MRMGKAVAAAVLSVLGVLVWILAGLRARDEPRSYSTASPPPAFVSVAAGHRYSLGTAGGLDALSQVADANNLDCTIGQRGGPARALAVSPETNLKALHRIGTFVAPYSGQVHVACSVIGDVYVDDPDGSTDAAGLLRVLAAVLLAVGLPLGLSVLASLHGAGRVGQPDELISAA